MAESVTLDPSELTTRTSLDLTPWIKSDGVSWGDAAIQATLSQQRAGAVPVDFTVPPRQIEIPLSLRDVGGTSFATVRSTLQAKIGLWQAQGGYLKRVLATGGTVFCDITDASLRLSGGWLQAHSSADVEASLTLTAIPDFYKAEETLSDHTETTLPEITFTETTVNGGDFPLGDRVRVVVDEDQGQNQRGMFWAFRGKNYSSASTAASAYEAEALQPLDTAAKAAKAGASGGTVVTHGTLSTNWTPVLGTNIGGTTWLTHTGTNRLYARVFTTSGTTVQSRFVYDTGDLVLPVENDAVRCYDGGTFHILDLGEVRLDQPANTTGYRWQGMIQAKGDAGAENFSVDRVWVVNSDESSGVLRAPPSISLGLSTYSARSEFTTESGVITGDSLAVGGTWNGAGNVNDFSVSGGLATRVASSDTAGGLVNGRLITASTPTTLTNTASRVDFKHSGFTGAYSGLLLRYTNTSNYLAVVALCTTAGLLPTLYIIKRVSGSDTTLATVSPGYVLATEAYYTIQATVDAQGNVTAFYGLQGFPFYQTTVQDSALATGGGLASGTVGIVDYNVTGSATRTYDNFAAWAIVADAVCYASRSLELNTKGNVRQDSGGTAYGPVSAQYIDLPRMPNQSSAGTVEFVGKFSRGDIATMPDPGVDDVSARVYRRASYLTVG